MVPTVHHTKIVINHPLTHTVHPKLSHSSPQIITQFTPNYHTVHPKLSHSSPYNPLILQVDNRAEKDKRVKGGDDLFQQHFARNLALARPVSRVSASDRCPFSKLTGHGSLSDHEVFLFYFPFKQQCERKRASFDAALEPEAVLARLSPFMN